MTCKVVGQGLCWYYYVAMRVQKGLGRVEGGGQQGRRKACRKVCSSRDKYSQLLVKWETIWNMLAQML